MIPPISIHVLVIGRMVLAEIYLLLMCADPNCKQMLTLSRQLRLLAHVCTIIQFTWSLANRKACISYNWHESKHAFSQLSIFFFNFAQSNFYVATSMCSDRNMPRFICCRTSTSLPTSTHVFTILPFLFETPVNSTQNMFQIRRVRQCIRTKCDVIFSCVSQFREICSALVI